MPQNTAEPTVDSVQPGAKWDFGKEVTTAFDDMLERSIPQYDVMRKACFDLGTRFVQPGTDIVDLGCAKGRALEPFVREFGAQNHYVGTDVSAPMLDEARALFEGYIAAKVVSIQNCDLRTCYPNVRSSLALAVLTLQFTPIEYRHTILERIFDHTVPGGALILVEKILGGDRVTDKLFVQTYYALKKENGYSQDQIERKRLSLEGVLVPVTATWNEEMLRQAGFRHVECFWRWMNFCGWIAVKS